MRSAHKNFIAVLLSLFLIYFHYSVSSSSCSFLCILYISLFQDTPREQSSFTKVIFLVLFSISIMEKVPEIRNSQTISGTIFPVNRKFPERCSGIMEGYGILFRKIPVYGTIIPEFSGKRFRKTS